MTGQWPIVPHALPSAYQNKSLATCQVTQERKPPLEETTRYLEKAARKMKKWADMRCSTLNFKVGDKVLFKVTSTQFKSQRKLHNGLIQKVWKAIRNNVEGGKALLLAEVAAIHESPSSLPCKYAQALSRRLDSSVSISSSPTFSGRDTLTWTRNC